MRRKHGNKKTTIDGIKFDSLMEGRRYEQLKLLQQAGVITRLECHPKFTLQEGFNLPHGKRIRAITYSADFQYLEDGVIVIEDVKGHQTEVNKIKLKMFAKKFRFEVKLIREA